MTRSEFKALVDADILRIRGPLVTRCEDGNEQGVCNAPGARLCLNCEMNLCPKCASETSCERGHDFGGDGDEDLEIPGTAHYGLVATGRVGDGGVLSAKPETTSPVPRSKCSAQGGKR